MRQLSTQDAWFLFAESARMPMHIGALSIYDASTVPGGRIAFEQIFAAVAARARRAESLRQRVARVPFDLDYPYWVDDRAFDLAAHVRRVALPEPGDWRALCALTATLHARSLDRARPLWTLDVIEGLDRVAGVPPGAFAILSKLHHAAADGASGVAIAASLHDPSPNAPAEAAAPDATRPEPSADAGAIVARILGRQLAAPFELASALAGAAAGLAATERTVLRRVREAPLRVPRTRFNASVSAQRSFDGRTFAIDAFRALASAVPGATINDAALCVCGGALRRYLAARGELPGASLVALAPINVRREGQVVAGNRVAAMRVALRTDIADPLARLAAIHDATAQSKAIARTVGASVWADASRAFPAPSVALAARLVTGWHLGNAIGPVCNAVVTNVPGPRAPLFMGGARMVAQYGLGPIVDGVGLFLAVLSAADRISVSVTSCRALLPDAERFGECIEESFAAAAAAAGRGSARGT